MKKSKQYDIFISYRREGGYETAQLISNHLKHLGYRVFFDLENLTGGEFNTQLLTIISNCKDFILVLPENGLNRCIDNPNDWVYRELEQAIKDNKNIIPVLLRGFEFPNTLPIEIDKVRNFNGVSATDHNYTDAALTKITSFLKSKRTISFTRYKAPIIITISLISVICGIFGIWQWQNYKQYTRICIEQTNLITAEFIRMDANLNVAKNAKAEWGNYLQNVLVASPSDTTRIKNEFRKYIQHSFKQLLAPTPGSSLSDIQNSILLNYNIPTEDIKCFYSTSRDVFYDEVNNYLNNLLSYSYLPLTSSTFFKNAKTGYDFLYYGLLGDYYALLELYTSFPKEIYKDFYKLKPNISNFTDIQTSLSKEEYESLQESTLQRLNEIVTDMGGDVKKESIDLDMLQQKYQDTKKKINDSIIEKNTTEINIKREKVESIKVELSKADNKLAETYQRMLTKHKINATDNQWLAWGKVVRIAYSANNSKITRGNIKDTMRSISVAEMFENVNVWLADYQKYYQTKDGNVPICVNAAKHFYHDVETGVQPYRGIIVMAIENNASHPVLKVGDIIKSRKGKPITTVNDYKKLNDDSATNVLEILRYSGSKRNIIEAIISTDCKIRFGMCDLTETLD